MNSLIIGGFELVANMNLAGDKKWPFDINIKGP